MAKTIKNVYDKVLTYDLLIKAHNDSKKGKGYRKDIILFNLKQEEYILWLYEKLSDMSYCHGTYTTFYISEPKVRKIEKAKYIDRIVQRWLVDNILKPIYFPKFIYSSFACINNKGMHSSCEYVQKMMKKAKNIYGEYYILKMDVAKYFDSINKEILIKILERKIKDKKVMWLIKQILYIQKKEVGIEIGNYTSQIFANIYLNEIDKYIKEELKIKYYARYMDDSVLIVKTKQQAKDILNKITEFLDIKLGLRLNSKTQIFKGKQGVNFCGYKINEYRLKIRDKGKRKLKKKIKKLKMKVKNGEISCYEARKYLAGHLGYMKIADTWNLENTMFYM